MARQKTTRGANGNFRSAHFSRFFSHPVYGVRGSTGVKQGPCQSSVVARISRAVSEGPLKPPVRRSSFLDLVVRGLWAGVGGSGGVLWRCCSAVDQKQNRGIGSFHESCVHDKQRANAGGMGREGRDVGLESSFARTKDPHRPADPQKTRTGREPITCCAGAGDGGLSTTQLSAAAGVFTVSMGLPT